MKAAELRKELERDKDLAALDTLIRIYSRPTIDTWKAYGIITIPPEVIDAFLTIGQANHARWGGEYERSKDTMHLELLQLADPKSEGRPNGKGHIKPVNGLDDLYSPRTQPKPVNGPP